MTSIEADREAKRPAAFFDFGGTLTKGDTLMPFLKFVLGPRKYYSKLFLISPVLIAYFLRLLPNDVAKSILLKNFLAGFRIWELFELGDQFGRYVIPRMLRPQGMERLRWHQKQGHDCILVSASLDVYLRAWAKDEEFSHVFCTALKRREDGLFDGGFEEGNCFGQEKLRRVRVWSRCRGPIDTFGYGDTSGDLPMLRFVRNGYIWSAQQKQFVVVQ